MPKLSAPVVLAALLWSGQAACSELEQVTNSLGMTFNKVPAGTFMMGSAPDAPGREPDEVRREVTLNEPFYLQTTPVTRGQWLDTR